MEQTGPELRKLYYTIGEVSALTGVPAHVLRYWEGEFAQLRPKKRQSGNRAYTDREIELIRKIKHLLYDRRFTIAGARSQLRNARAEEEGDSDVLSEVKQGLHEILDILNNKSGRGAAR